MNNIITAVVATVHHFVGKNYSRYLGKGASLHANPAQKAKLILEMSPGWWENEIVNCVKLTAAQKKQAVKEREAEWTRLQASTDAVEAAYYITEGDKKGSTGTTLIAAAEMRESFQDLYTADGKIIVPEYRGVHSYRRADCLVAVHALSKRGFPGCVAITELPIRVKTYADEKQIKSECIRENTHKEAGQRKLNWRDLVSGALHLWDSMMSQAEAGRELQLKRGPIQKVWYLVQIIKKSGKAMVDGKEINYSKVFEDLIFTIPEGDAKDPVTAYKHGDLSKLRGDELEDGGFEFPDGLEAGRRYLTDPWAGNKGADKPMTAKDLEKLKQRSPVLFARDFATHALNNDMEFFSSLSPMADVLNEVHEALSSGGKRMVMVVDSEDYEAVKALIAKRQKDRTKNHEPARKIVNG